MRSSSSRPLAFVLAALLLLFPATPARAGEPLEPMRAQILLMLRILAYDHGLKERAGDRVTLLVLHHPTDSASLRRRDELVASWSGLEKIRVAGIPVAMTTAALSDPALLAAKVHDLRPAAVIVCPGLERDVPTIRALARSASMLSFGPTAAELAQGLAVAIVPDENRFRILINVAASRAEGVKFDAVLLELATAVEESSR
jgi:hypothetical protein